MSDSSTVLAAVVYYAQEGYYHRIQTEILEVMKGNGSEPILVYWKAYSLVMSGHLMEGMRELERIVDKDDVMLCAILLLIYAHKKCETIDREAVQKLEDKVRSERTSCGEKALYNAGMFLWLSGRHDKAREYIDRMLKITPSSDKGLAIRGWIDLTSGRETLVKKSIKYFDDSMTGPKQPKLVESLFGKAKYYMMRFNFSHSLNMLNQAVASYDGFIPALIEKMKAQLALQDWEQTLDTVQRCLILDVNCIEAIRIQTLSLLALEGNYSEAAGKIGELIQLIDRFEPDNHALYCDVSSAFARMAGGKILILQQTMTLVNRALSLSPNNSDYINELAYQYYLNGQIKDSLLYYRKALNTDETSVTALAGIIFFQILDGQLSEAEQQLEFLDEVQSSIGRQATLVFLNGLLAQKKKKPASEVIPILNETVEIHFTAVKGIPLSSKYYHHVNPQFILELVKAILVYAPTEPAASSSQVDPLLKRAAAILGPISRNMPGMVSTQYQLARIHFLIGELESAQALLQKAIENDSNFMEAHLLTARIHLYLGNIKQCSASLEIALSSNFEVQNFPIYHLIKAKSERHVGNIEAALASLQTAMSFITAKNFKHSNRSPSKLLPPLTLSEQVTVYLELASIHTQLGNTHEATKIIQDAINEFTGTAEEFRITITNAEFALARGDVDEALSLLKNVKEDNLYYIEAKEKMAEIYLNKKKESKMYITCYEELATKLPGPPTALLLGDAYMSVQEPEQALVVYEASLKRNAYDSILARKIGQALIKTHNYSKAILYYETALKSEMQQFLRGDLAELYLKLSQFDKAENTLIVALEPKDEVMDLSQMIENVKYMVILSKVHRKAKRPEKSLEVLSTATDLQSKILTRVVIEQPDAVQAQKEVAASISFDLAELSYQILDTKNAIRFYSEALRKTPDFSKARLALARLFLNIGELDACDQECVTMIKMDQDNEEATLMRADLLLFRGSSMYKEATQHLQELLSREPAHFKALYRLVELTRKLGELESAQAYLDQAEKACSQSAYEPGLNFCKGLYKRYRLEMNDALYHFNQARRDSDWGQQALFNMIEICLNPDNDMIAGEALKPINSGDSNVSEDQMALRTAEKLLLEIHPQSPASEHRVHVLECRILLSTRQKSNIERVLEMFMSMASNRRNDVSLLLGIATAYMMIRQVPRARNHLKIASKVQWTPEYAEEFEQTWLLLADIYIQSGKYDMALDLLKKCILYNRSCSKAWEYKGFISEKEQAYKDAATCYEKAWRYSYHANPTVGFKLGFNYLKARWFVDAIDVCHQVLEKHPNYPKIRKEILDKARMSLRT